MKKISLFLSLILLVLSIQEITAQNILRVHNSDHLIYQQKVENIDSLKLGNNNSDFFPNTGMFALPIAGIDSITFANNTDDEIYIIYNAQAPQSSIRFQRKA